VTAGEDTTLKPSRNAPCSLRHRLEVLVKPSIQLTEEHAQIRAALGHLRNSLVGLGDENVKEQRRSMDLVIRWLEEHIETHTKLEDIGLYPAIEQHVGTHSLTAALRVEHGVIRRNVDQLRRLAADPVPDARAFTSLLDNLAGLFFAHFEAEEVVLFPILDEMTARGVVVGTHA
jgi:hemerythrin-like domain-containing protein